MNGVHDMGGMDGFTGIHDMGGMDGFGPAEREVAVDPAPTARSET